MLLSCVAMVIMLHSVIANHIKHTLTHAWPYSLLSHWATVLLLLAAVPGCWHYACPSKHLNKGYSGYWCILGELLRDWHILQAKSALVVNVNTDASTVTVRCSSDNLRQKYWIRIALKRWFTTGDVQRSRLALGVARSSDISCLSPFPTVRSLLLIYVCELRDW